MAQGLSIRLATIDDMENVFNLSNDNVVRKNSFNTEKIKWEEHVKWFEKKIADVNTLFYVEYKDNEFVGYCRLDKNENNEWVVTIHINPKFRAKGYGKNILNYVCIQNVEKTIISYVKIENIPSCKLFECNNFINAGVENILNTKCQKFEYKKPSYVIAISNNLYDTTDIYKKKNVMYLNKKESLTVENLKKINPKYVFFPHWSYIIPAEIYENFNCIVFHMTDLPYGRGGSPLQNLIERGINKTKISAIKCVKELDGGDIYLKKEFDISYGSAQEIYMRAGAIISKMIDAIIFNNPNPIPQKGEIVEFKRRKPEQSNLKDLTDLSKIYDYIRMLDADGYPKAFLETDNIKFEFTNAKIDNGKVTANVEIKVKNE